MGIILFLISAVILFLNVIVGGHESPEVTWKADTVAAIGLIVGLILHFMGI